MLNEMNQPTDGRTDPCDCELQRCCPQVASALQSCFVCRNSAALTLANDVVNDGHQLKILCCNHAAPVTVRNGCEVVAEDLRLRHPLSLCVFPCHVQCRCRAWMQSLLLVTSDSPMEGEGAATSRGAPHINVKIFFPFVFPGPLGGPDSGSHSGMLVTLDEPSTLLEVVDVGAAFAAKLLPARCSTYLAFVDGDANIVYHEVSELQ